jgi:stage V sporulation protein G
MKITQVTVYPALDGTKLKAYATIVFEDSFIVRDIKIIEGPKGLFVSMPSRKTKTGTYRDIVHPLNQEMRKMIENFVVLEYNKAVQTGFMHLQPS